MAKRSSNKGGIVGRMVGVFLTNKGRRMIVVISVAAYLHTLHRGGELSLSKVNDKVRLSESEEALKFPATLGSKLWSDSGIEDLDLASGKDSIVKRLLDHMPRYLQYGRYSDMEKDLRQVIGCIN